MRAFAVIGWLCGTVVHAQWDVPGRLQFDGTTDAEKQVTGLAMADAPTNGISAGTQRTQAVSFGTVTGIDQLSLTLAPAPSAYTPGMTLGFEASSANTGAVTLNVNGLGAVPVVKFITDPLDSADLQPGIPVQVVYDGAAFQLVSQSHPACPTGFMAITRDVCIETAFHDSTTFYGASNFCVDRSARLCTFGEWYQACAMPGGIFPSVVAFEWVDHAANNSNYAKRVGSNSSNVLDCKNGGLAVPLFDVRFRCCWDR